MRIFVTGATGFIGQHFVRQAIQSGDEVIALSRTIREPSHANLQFVRAELDDSNLIPHLEQCQVLVHFAATGMGTPPAWEDCFQVNVMKSLACWRLAVRSGIRRFILCGSSQEYGRSADRYDFIPPDARLEPTEPYGASKAAATEAGVAIAHRDQVELAILRPFHVFGEGDSLPRFWNSLRQAALQGIDFPLTPGEQVRDFVPVETVARKFLEFCRRPLVLGRPEIHNVGSGLPQRLIDFAKAWWARWQAPGQLLPGKLAYRPQEVMRCVPWLPMEDIAR